MIKQLLLSIFFPLSISAGFMTGTLVHKDDTDILVLGDELCDLETNLHSTRIIKDTEQKNILFTNLGSLESDVVFLHDVHPDEIPFREELIKTAIKHPELTYLGMHSLIAQKAYQKKQKLHYLGYDSRDERFRIPIQLYMNINGATRETLDRNEPTNVSPEQLHLAVNALPKVSVQTYKQRLDELEKTHKESDIPSIIEQARMFLKPFSDSDNLGKALASGITRDGFTTFFKNNSWIHQLNRAVCKIDMQKTLKQALASYKKIIVYGGQGYTEELLTSLKSDGFQPVLAYGNQKVVKTRTTTDYIPKQAITTLLQRLKHGYNPCAKCAKKDNVKYCGKCKATYYCSIECQKADWKSHQKDCVTIENVN